MTIHIEIPIIRKKVKYSLPWLMGLIVAGVLIVGTMMTLGVVNRRASKQDITQLTVPVQAKTITVRITATGKIQPIQSVNISPKNPGILAKLYVEQGQKLQQGQIIAQMDNSEIKTQVIQYQASLDQAKAQLAESQAGSRPEDIAEAKAHVAEAEAQLTVVREGNRLQEIEQAQAQVDSAQAQMELTQARLKRYQELAKAGAISQDSLEQYTSEDRQAKASLEEAQRRLSLQKSGNRNEDIKRQQAIVAQEREALRKLQNGSRPEELTRLRASVVEANAKLEQQQVQLADTIIRAPFSGTVTQKYATLGAYVSPAISASSDASATSTSIIALAKGLEVVAKVPEVDIPHVKVGQKVELIIDAYADEVFHGYVRLISPEAIVEQNVTSFQVRVQLDTESEKLRSGMNVDNVIFIGKTIPNALLVPQETIVTQHGKTGVMMPDTNNQPQFRPVTVGVSVDSQIQVLQGLKAGDRIFNDLPEDKQPKPST
ncbi:efflux RND transporter periplasmic adaptor subunit [Nostoc punctiforme]|uniref:Efflux transporter, RND family, MFP subunit n=1 Tax=Nostoc punctiforme (strain ATCC 29133 / PCC 73102) TaxID=63737 RepID=B2IXK3_NOSP7|nr:efflux RND transporter periplasmic adaptor subunit [Nostoc punctiforme]ACC81531.1 efflux transporter, RND family, MFP subunit [Nostoc punctiforme PCC 73102]